MGQLKGTQHMANPTLNTVKQTYLALTDVPCTVDCGLGQRRLDGTYRYGANVWERTHGRQLAHADGKTRTAAIAGLLTAVLAAKATERVEKAVLAYAQWKACSKAFLVAEYQRSHRVSDCREMSKGDLAVALLRDAHGAATARAVLALPRLAVTALLAQ
jgi:hypothetical protein